jgi:hypothetical protein
MHQEIRTYECEIIGCRKRSIFFNDGFKCSDHHVVIYKCRNCRKFIEKLSHTGYLARVRRVGNSVSVDLNLEYCDRCWNKKMIDVGVR